MRVLLALLLAFYAFPSDIEGLREIKIGDKVPLTGELSNIEAKEKKTILLYLKSDELKSIAFFRQFIKFYTPAKKKSFFLIDLNSETDKRVIILYEKLKGQKKLINDPARKIYGDLGVIVLPTLLFIDEAELLNSAIFSYRPNLALFFKQHLHALEKGEKPGDVYKEYDNKIEQRKFNRITSQAFILLLDRSYELAGNMYKKAVEKDNKNIEAKLGYGFTLLIRKKVKEAELFFLEELKTYNSKRLKLGLYLSRSLLDPSENNLENLSRFALIEPSLFPVIFEAAEILQKNGKTEPSNKVFKRSYRVLLRIYRRNK